MSSDQKKYKQINKALMKGPRQGGCQTRTQRMLTSASSDLRDLPDTRVTVA